MQQLTDKQNEFILNKSRYKVANWGRRSGKTTLFAYEALGTALSINNAHVTYYAQTFGDARDIAWNIFIDTFGAAVLKKNETLLELTVRNIHGGTSKISLKGWESVVTSSRGRGTENDLLLFDEVAFCRQFMYLWETVLEPTLLTTKGRAVFGSTPNGYNHFYDLSLKAQHEEGWFYSHATSYDNPYNDPAELERIRAARTEDVFAQEYLADFRKLEGLVYKEFDRNIHLFDDFTERRPTVRILCGIDFGFTNPTAILKIEKDGDSHYWVTWEWYKKERPTSEIVEVARAVKANVYYPDPAEPDRIAELERAGLNIHDVSKDVEAGIGSVRDLLKQNRLHIHKSCVNLIQEFETYRYEESRPERNLPESPIKENDHALDALRYPLHMDAPNIELYADTLAIY